MKRWGASVMSGRLVRRGRGLQQRLTSDLPAVLDSFTTTLEIKIEIYLEAGQQHGCKVLMLSDMGGFFFWQIKKERKNSF